MRTLRYVILAAVLFCLLSGVAGAGEVQVFKPADEEVSTMELRQRAMAEGFALAVLQEAQTMLGTPLDEARGEAFKQYMLTQARQYIQGYKILSSKVSGEGVALALDVRVNRKLLREGLKSMGLFAAEAGPLTASISWPEGVPEETVVGLQQLMTLTGIRQGVDVLPSFTLEPGPKDAFKARLEMDKQEFVAIDKDLRVLWFKLWSKYFNRDEGTVARSGVQTLSVDGWFAPDAVLEFDGVLRAWESAVQEARLVELDMQPSGVGGVWEVRLLNASRLDSLLKSYLPQRGLTYRLSEKDSK
ncbi:hypothetical protein GM415_14580 [Pseudodesulfovibrio cashew]|uniref:Lipoprotein n=1 Tax=Pseudodesulfovibrio cashew TaxID=2678688 RepID=A0A6I6JJV3_9BACT|nr:hypothetical protein [Pseudodesulfovibrio cashew]QGY41300.1 hypothetical protein GM415_14580 [Pseudodesulfovibrio cashew]